MNLDKARITIANNVEAQALYMKTIDDAEKKMNDSFVEIPFELSIKLGMIDHYRRKHPDVDKSDDDILKHIEYLFETYDDVPVQQPVSVETVKTLADESIETINAYINSLENEITDLSGFSSKLDEINITLIEFGTKHLDIVVSEDHAVETHIDVTIELLRKVIAEINDVVRYRESKKD